MYFKFTLLLMSLCYLQESSASTLMELQASHCAFAVALYDGDHFPAIASCSYVCSNNEDYFDGRLYKKFSYLSESDYYLVEVNLFSNGSINCLMVSDPSSSSFKVTGEDFGLTAETSITNTNAFVTQKPEPSATNMTKTTGQPDSSNITVTTGNSNSSASNITVTTGNSNSSATNITVTTGNSNSSATNIAATPAMKCPSSIWSLNENFGKCYIFRSDPATFEDFFDAEVFCNEHEGHLVSIHSDSENEFISGNITGGSRYWIGLKDETLSGVYYSDATPVDYAKWDVGQPDKGTTCAGDESCTTQYNCVSVSGSNGTEAGNKGTWKNLHCGTINGFVCGVNATVAVITV